MLQPKRTKFRKQQKGRNRGLAQSGNKVSFGEFGLSLGVFEVRAAIFHRFLGALLGFERCGLVEVRCTDSRVGQDGDEMRLNLEHTAGDEVVGLLAAGLLLDTDFARLEAGNKRGMAGRDTELTHDARCIDHLGKSRMDLPLCADDVDMNSHSHCLLPLVSVSAFHLLGFLDSLVDGAAHVEGLLGQVVVLTLDDCLEVGDGVLEADIAARRAREDFRDEEGL